MLHRIALRSQLVCRAHLRSSVLGGLTSIQRPLLGSSLPERCDGVQAFKHHASAFGLLHKRCFSATKPPEGELDEEKAAEALQNEKSVLRKFYGAGTLLSTGLIAYGAWWGTNSLMKIVGAVYSSPHIVAYVGFWAGFGSATLCAALATAVYRLSFIRPEFAFKDTLTIVKNNDAVKSALGDTVRDGKLKSYEIQGGMFTVKGGMPSWVPHKLQMMYMVYGEKGTGLVTTVVVKKPSLVPQALDPTLLAVDFLDKEKINNDTETVIIVGDEEQLKVRDNIYRLLDLKLDFATGAQK